MVSLVVAFVAVIDTGFFGVVAGAVKTPEDVIVPVEAEPPATPFTCHVKLTRDTSLPVVRNCTLCPEARSPVLGVTLKLAGWKNLGLPDEEFPDAQPDRTMPRTKNRLKIVERCQDRYKSDLASFQACLLPQDGNSQDKKL